MQDLNTVELTNVAGGDNCLCRESCADGDAPKFYKTTEVDGPSCVVSCCERAIIKYSSSTRIRYFGTSYSWTWFGNGYSTQGTCADQK